MARESKDIQALITTDHIEDRIFLVRGKKIMLDTELAGLYGVTTSRLNEQVKRNAERFPDDFTFRLTNQEVANLMSQNATSRTGFRKHGGRRKLPLAFTEHGAIMAASVLNSPRAVEVSVFVVRAFVKLRELSVSHKEITKKLDELERKVTGHDQAIAGLIDDAIRTKEKTADRFCALEGKIKMQLLVACYLSLIIYMDDIQGPRYPLVE